MTSSVEASGVRPRAGRARSARARSRRDAGYFGRRIAGSPWSNGDLIRLLFWQVAGGIGIAITWFGSSGEVDFRDQGIWTAFAVLAAVLAAGGGASFLLAGLGEVARERRAAREDLAELYGVAGRASQRVGSTDTAELAAVGFVTADGMRRYHRPSCDVVRGKATRPVPAPAGAAAGGGDLKPCGMCQS